MIFLSHHESGPDQREQRRCYTQCRQWKSRSFRCREMSFENSISFSRFHHFTFLPFGFSNIFRIYRTSDIRQKITHNFLLFLPLPDRNFPYFLFHFTIFHFLVWLQHKKRTAEKRRDIHQNQTRKAPRPHQTIELKNVNLSMMILCVYESRKVDGEDVCEMKQLVSCKNTVFGDVWKFFTSSLGWENWNIYISIFHLFFVYFSFLYWNKI